MIFISSSCIKGKTINDAINVLYQNGFRNIELSGGTKGYSGLVGDLEKWKNKGCKFILHNYFPPPPVPFVINLASLNPEIRDLSLSHVKRAIRLSERLGIDKYGVHAGFLIDIPVNQIGAKVSKLPFFHRDTAIQSFVENVRMLQSETKVKLYLENNVISPSNLTTFDGVNPFLLTCSSDYLEFVDKIEELNLILDIGHLKVSSNAMGLNFEKEMESLMSVTDYIHVSDNDGTADMNLGLNDNSDMLKVLKKHDLKNKVMTLEIYNGIDSVIETFMKLSKEL